MKQRVRDFIFPVFLIALDVAFLVLKSSSPTESLVVCEDPSTHHENTKESTPLFMQIVFFGIGVFLSVSCLVALEIEYRSTHILRFLGLIFAGFFIAASFDLSSFFLRNLLFGIGMIHIYIIFMVAFQLEYRQSGNWCLRLLGLIIKGIFIAAALTVILAGIAIRLKETCTQNPSLPYLCKRPLNESGSTYVKANCSKTSSFPDLIPDFLFLLSYAVRVIWMLTAKTNQERMGVLLFFLLLPFASMIGRGCAGYFGLEASTPGKIIPGYALGWIMGWIFVKKKKKVIHDEGRSPEILC